MIGLERRRGTRVRDCYDGVGEDDEQTDPCVSSHTTSGKRSLALWKSWRRSFCHASVERSDSSSILGGGGLFVAVVDEDETFDNEKLW